MNKYVEKYHKIVKGLIRNAFPKLKNKKILICESDDKKFKLHFADTYYFILFWRIRIGKKLRKFPDEFLKGALAHELSHIEIFEKRNFIRKIISGFKCLVSENFREKEEKNTDKITIQKGYGKELYSFRKHTLSISDEKTKARIKRFYLFLSEIKQYMKKLKK